LPEQGKSSLLVAGEAEGELYAAQPSLMKVGMTTEREWEQHSTQKQFETMLPLSEVCGIL